MGTRELALLRAVGLSRKQARRLIFSEATLLGVIGTGVGLLTGAGLTAPLLRATSTPEFAASYIYPWNAAAGVLVAVFVAVCLAAVLPARRAMDVNIVSALRSE